MGLKDPRHERFAVLLGTGKALDPEAAWCEAFEQGRGSKARAAADELLADPNVKERVRQAQQAVLDEVANAEAWALTTLKGCIQRSYEEGKYQTAISGIKLFGQHRSLQLFPQRVDHHTHADPLEGMSREDLIAEAVRLKLIEPAHPVEALPAEIIQ